MEPYQLERLNAIVLLVLGIAILLSMMILIGGMAFLLTPLLYVAVILGVVALFAGIAMWIDSRKEKEY